MPLEKLSIRLLGPLQAQHDHNLITNFKTDSVRALLAILALRQGQMQRRDTLATLLAPDDKTDQEALAYLRIALSRLRDALNDRQANPSYLIINRKALTLDIGDHVWVDTTEFYQLLDEVEQHPHRDAAQCPSCIDRLERAIALVRGDLLAGLNFHSASWEAWLRETREQIQVRKLQAFVTLGSWHAAQKNWPALHSAAQGALAIEPWREQAHRWAMEAHWKMGELGAAISQYERCTTLLDKEFGVPPDTATTMLYELISTEQSRKERKTLQSSDDTPHNLPRVKTRFFGRNSELNQLKRLLTDRTFRLITIIGPGGIGKTRLAQETGRQLLSVFPDGVWFVPLVGTLSSGGDHILAAIAQALDFSFSRQTPLIQQLANFLRRAELLLILDNMEQLLDDAHVLIELLERTENLAMLCTSREVLNFEEEMVIPLQGFDPQEVAPNIFGKGEDATIIRSLPLRSPIVGLFKARAERANGQFQLTSQNAVQILEIGERVDGSPLGLELAASWVRSRSIPQIIESIDSSVDFLSTRRRDLPRRHRSMRAVFETSWDMLEVDEQEIFADLAVFRGGFSAEAAATVVGATLDDLDILVEKSLIELENNRYTIHELIREFAKQHQDTPLELKKHHSDYYIAFLLARADGFHGMSPHIVTAEIQIEERNVWYALLLAGENDTIDIVRCAKPLIDYVCQQARYREGIPPLLDALRGQWKDAPELHIQLARLQQELDQYDAALKTAQRLLKGTTTPLALQAQAHLICALCHQNLGDRVAWEAALKQAQKVAKEADDALLGAVILRHLGVSAIINHNNFGLAESYFSQSSELSTVLQNAIGIGWAQNNLGNIYLFQGNLVQAELTYQKAITQFVRIGLGPGEQSTRLNLAHIYLDLGNFNSARQQYISVLRYREKTNEPTDITLALGSLGNVLTKIGQVKQAVKYLYKALTLCQQNQLLRHEAQIWLLLGRAQALEADHDLALQSYQQAEKYGRQVGDEPLLAAIQSNLGDLYTLYENKPLAYKHYTQALEMLEASQLMPRFYEALVARIHVTADLEEQKQQYARLQSYISTFPTNVGFEDVVLFYWRCSQAAEQHATELEAGKLLQHAHNLLHKQMATFENKSDLKAFTNIPHHINILLGRNK